MQFAQQALDGIGARKTADDDAHWVHDTQSQQAMVLLSGQHGVGLLTIWDFSWPHINSRHLNTKTPRDGTYFYF